MTPRARRSFLSGLAVCLLVAGAIAPVAVMGLSYGSIQSQVQLSTLLSAALASRSYAYSTVDTAASHGLAVGPSQAQLAEADALLASAQGDARSGSNVTAGIQSVHAAMNYYTDAAISASLALDKAGLASSLEYSETLGTVAAVNATASVVASAAAQGCSAASASNSSALEQACVDVRSQISAATLHLDQAASLLMSSGGQSNATIGQAGSLVATAQAEVAAGQSDLAAIASFSYSQRGHAYFTSVLQPLSASANSTIGAEESFQANLTQFHSAFDAYAIAEESAAVNVTLSVSALANAIAQVNTTAVSSAIGASESTAAAVEADMAELQALPGIRLLTGVSADANATGSAASTYLSALSSAAADSASYSTRSISSFAQYLTAADADSTAVSTSGSAYVSAYAKAIGDLGAPAVLSIPGVQAIYSGLSGLQVSGDVSTVGASLGQELTAMTAVNGDEAAASLTITSAEANIQAPAVVSGASRLFAEGSIFLNQTAAGAASNANSSVHVAAGWAQTFLAAANGSLTATIGAIGSYSQAVASAQGSLALSTGNSVQAVASLVGYVGSDVASRTSDIADAQAQISAALAFFAGLDIPHGAEAAAQAYLFLEAASTLNP
jgi:hypothetical protein